MAQVIGSTNMYLETSDHVQKRLHADHIIQGGLLAAKKRLGFIAIEMNGTSGTKINMLVGLGSTGPIHA